MDKIIFYVGKNTSSNFHMILKHFVIRFLGEILLKENYWIVRRFKNKHDNTLFICGIFGTPNLNIA